MMKSKFFLTLSVLFAITTHTLHAFDSVPFEEGSRWRTCFTPNEKGQQKCSDMIVDIIDTATESIRMQAYSFTAQPIADALTRAAERGVDVKVIFDKGQGASQYSQKLPLADTKVKVYVDRPSRLAHNKVIVVDKNITITGSFNYSKSAQVGNTENLIAIQDPKLAETYYKNWLRRYTKVTRQKTTRNGGYTVATPNGKKAAQEIALIKSPDYTSSRKRKTILPATDPVESEESTTSESWGDPSPKHADKKDRQVVSLTPNKEHETRSSEDLSDRKRARVRPFPLSEIINAKSPTALVTAESASKTDDDDS